MRSLPSNKLSFSKSHKQVINQQQYCLCNIVKAIIAIFVLVQVIGVIYLANYASFENTLSTFERYTSQSLQKLRTASTLPDSNNNIIDPLPVFDSLSKEKEGLTYHGYPTQIITKKEETNRETIPATSKELLINLFGAENHLIHVNFPDLQHHSSSNIRARYPQLFQELPAYGFLPEYKNPCWYKSLNTPNAVQNDQNDVFAQEESSTETKQELVCLPYAYILGQPKSGTSDLYERLKTHQEIM